jgi:hypothetical protein
MCRGLTRLTQSPAAHPARVSPASSAALSVRRRRDVEYKSIAASTSCSRFPTFNLFHFPTFDSLDFLGLLTPIFRPLPAPLPLSAFALSWHGFPTFDGPPTSTSSPPSTLLRPALVSASLESDSNAYTASTISHRCLEVPPICLHSVIPFLSSLPSSSFCLELTTTTLVQLRSQSCCADHLRTS